MFDNEVKQLYEDLQRNLKTNSETSLNNVNQEIQSMRNNIISRINDMISNYGIQINNNLIESIVDDTLMDNLKSSSRKVLSQNYKTLSQFNDSIQAVVIEQAQKQISKETKKEQVKIVMDKFDYTMQVYKDNKISMLEQYNQLFQAILRKAPLYTSPELVDEIKRFLIREKDAMEEYIKTQRNNIITSNLNSLVDFNSYLTEQTDFISNTITQTSEQLEKQIKEVEETIDNQVKESYEQAEKKEKEVIKEAQNQQESIVENNQLEQSKQEVKSTPQEHIKEDDIANDSSFVTFEQNYSNQPQQVQSSEQQNKKSRYEREQELLTSGLVDEIKRRFGYNSSISNDYYMLITDYIDSLNQVNSSLHIDAVQIVNNLPQLITSIREADLGGIHGRTDEHDITMNSNLSYEQKKLYFFHEMTHAIQTSKINNQEVCSFYNGNDGMFLTEGATQYTAEILYNVSNGTNIDYREQRGVVRGQSEHRTYSPLSEYQLNGNMIQLLSKVIDLPIPDILAMGYRKDGREMLKQWYETYPNIIGFDELMSDLEKIYDIDKLVIAGYSSQLSGEPVNIQRNNGQTFKGNLQTENDLIVQTERNLMASFIGNHDENYIFQNYEEFCASLTTPRLRVEFLGAVKELQEFVKQNGMQNENVMTLSYRPNGFTNYVVLSVISIVIGLIIIFFIVKGVLM